MKEGALRLAGPPWAWREASMIRAVAGARARSSSARERPFSSLASGQARVFRAVGETVIQRAAERGTRLALDRFALRKLQRKEGGNHDSWNPGPTRRRG